MTSIQFKDTDLDTGNIFIANAYSYEIILEYEIY